MHFFIAVLYVPNIPNVELTASALIDYRNHRVLSILCPDTILTILNIAKPYIGFTLGSCKAPQSLC